MTKIEWATETWNPITGCTKISEGCRNCYAERMSKRLAGRFGYPKDNPFKIVYHDDRLEQPSKWKKPRMIFVCSMGDLFHEHVEIFRGIRVLAEAKAAPHHTYLFLTKRPEIMLEAIKLFLGKDECPPKNWWLGVTAENQQRAEERIPVLLQIPASVRFVSIEPMLSTIDIKIVPCRYCNHPGDVLSWPCPICRGRRFELPDWIICGGETGPGARAMHPYWPISLKSQCEQLKIPFFFKKWGNNKIRTINGRVYEQTPINSPLPPPTKGTSSGK